MTTVQTAAVLMLSLIVSAGAGTASGQERPSPATDASTIGELHHLADRQRVLEERVDRLEREKAENEKQLAQERATVARLQASASAIPFIPNEVAEVGLESPGVPTTEWGSRLGYQGFPFGQRQGGFYYSVYVDHRLLGMDVGGLRYGDLSGEVAIGLGKSGSDHITVTSDLMGGRKINAEYRQTMLSVWPTLKYSMLLLKPYGLRPY